MFDSDAFKDHESVHHFHDPATGLKAIIAVHSTALGPGAGGCRMWNYPDANAALRDVLRLSEGMSYKNAAAGLDLGGAKAVIWGDSRTQKTPELFRALGRCIDRMNGQYWSAEDVGVSPDDMRYAREETRFVAGLDDGPAASGDPSPWTALGVYLCMLESAKRTYGVDDLKGMKIAIQGVGSVGGYLAGHLAEAGAELFVADVNEAVLEQVSASTGATVVSPESIYDVDAEVFSPNALGAVLNQDTLPRIKARLICGSANNQLATPEIGVQLLQSGQTYAPDFVVNGGGIINVASEISGEYSKQWVKTKIHELVATLTRVLDEADTEKRPTHDVAVEFARRRIANKMTAD